MTEKHIPHSTHDHSAPAERPTRKWWTLSFWAMGLGSLAWLLFRSGTKPQRATYPCQRVAAANSAGFLAYLAALLGSATLLRRLRVSFSPSRLVLLTVALLLTASLHGSVATPATPLLADSPDLPSWTSDNAVSNVFAITNVPEPQYSLNGGVIPGGVSADDALHDDGVDALVNLMETHGDYFYKTTGHPSGLFGTDDVIVIKVNNQWDGRNGTNTDVVKGVIYRLLQHPEGFSGAVIVAENPQGRNEDWYHQSSGNNSQFLDQSYLEAVQAFASQGEPVCLSNWDTLRATSVNDYDQDNNNDGYVFLDADGSDEERDHFRLSYPKFQTNCNGTTNWFISMRQGIWNGSAFDSEHLKMINLPVLKRHNTSWATIAVKNYLGFITTYDSNGARWGGVPEMHCWLLGIRGGGDCPAYNETYGLIARQMGHIRRADLDIVDAVWVNPRDNVGWNGEAQRLDVLLASRDPFAVDYYASDYILGPLIRQQYGDGSGYEQAMSSTPGGIFRTVQLHNVARLRTEGIVDTINIDDSMTIAEELAQFNVYVADANAPQAPTLTLSVPDGGENWDVGAQEQITWSSSNLAGDVHLEYSTSDFASANPIADLAADVETYTWTIPDAPSDSVLVRVSSVLTSTISDTSDAVFSITSPPAPSLTLLAPNGGESWETGTQQQITWSSDNLAGDIRLEYSTDSFSSTNVISDSMVNVNSYTWTIPDDVSDNVLVRVSSVITSTISDTSNAVFSITSSPAPTLTLLSPNGGERWEMGTQQQIIWTSSNLSGYVCLEYSTDGFASTHPIDDCTPNDGLYDWTVPNEPSDSVLIRISSLGSAAINDTCAAPFSIVGSHTVLDSFKQVSRDNIQGGETVVYTVVLYEEISATLAFSDTLPSPLTYVHGSANVEPGGTGSLLISDALYWSGTVTGAQPVTITFQAQAPVTNVAPQLVINRAHISRNGETPIERTAAFFLNGIHSYLPLVVRNYQD